MASKAETLPPFSPSYARVMSQLMAWSENLLDAKFRGIVFDMENVDDSLDRALAEHAYPYVDGADVEDLGSGAKSISVHAVFFGDDYDVRLQSFLVALDTPGTGELVHPVFGTIKSAQVRSRSIRHDAESPDTARVAIQFVESTTSAPFFDRSLPVQKADAIGAASDAARGLSTNALGSLIDTLRTLNPLKTFNSLRTTMLAPILSLQSQVSGIVLASLDVIGVPRSWAADLDSLTGGVLDLMNPLDPFGSWRQAGNTLSLLLPHSSGGSSAAAVTAITPAAMQAQAEAQASAAIGAHVSVALATAQADAAGVVFTAEADTPTLSPPQLEAIANDARMACEAAITAARNVWPLETSHAIVEGLKTTALAVQTAAQSIIEARLPLITRTIVAPGNLRLVAHRWYGDHTRAPELCRLNNLRLPNFIQPGDQLNGYAS